MKHTFPPFNASSDETRETRDKRDASDVRDGAGGQPAEKLANKFDGLQNVMDYSGEFVAAKMKAAIAGHALTRLDGAHMASIDDILSEDGFNLRVPCDDLDGYIRWIADSIKLVGFLPGEPLEVFAAVRGKKAVFIVTEGHCRLAAARLAQSEGAEVNYLPILIKPSETTMEDLFFSMMSTGRKRGLKPYEFAIGCKRLRSFNVPHEMIAKRLGISIEYVHQLLELAAAPYAIRAMVEKGEVTAALAINTMRAEGEQAKTVLLNALEVAKADGRQKVTAKHLPSQIYKKALAKSAPKMLDTIQRIKACKQFGRLPQETRRLIEDVLLELNDIQKVDNLN